MADDGAGMAEFMKGARKKFDILVGRFGASIVQVGGKHIPALVDATNAMAEWDFLEVSMRIA